MIETLEKMSGKRHVVYRDSKTVTKDVENLIEFTNVEGKVSYTMSVREEPIITYTDMAFIGERQSIVFRAGDAPVWNRNEMILPMSWRLFQNTIKMPGRDYSLQTIPTLSTAGEYDPRRNQPDFKAMLEHRKTQAVHSKVAQEAYRVAFDYTEAEVARLDRDVYSDAVMGLIDREMHLVADDAMSAAEEEDYHRKMAEAAAEDDLDNDEVAVAVEEASTSQAERELPRFAMGQLSRENVNPSIELELVAAYNECSARLWRDPQFRRATDGGLQLADGTSLIERVVVDSQTFVDAAKSPASRVFAEAEAVAEAVRDSWRITEGGFRFFRNLPDWAQLAGGDFDRQMAQLIKQRDQS